MSRRRRSYEPGHKPKFLVVIDESPECDRAVYFASRRVARIGADLVMLLIIEPHDRHEQWLGVAGLTPERAIREGEVADEILNLIEEDEDIAILVLAAGTGKEGPGPLVSSLSKTAGAYPIPVAIVPGHLSDEELDAMS